jgi:hypothetical protein
MKQDEYNERSNMIMLNTSSPSFNASFDTMLKKYGISIMRSFSGTEPDGNPVNMAAKSADVLRHQDNGTWRL